MNNSVTERFTVTANAQNTLQHFQGQVPPLLMPAGAHGWDSILFLCEENENKIWWTTMMMKVTLAKCFTYANIFKMTWIVMRFLWTANHRLFNELAGPASPHTNTRVSADGRMLLKSTWWCRMFGHVAGVRTGSDITSASALMLRAGVIFTGPNWH